MFIHYFVRVPRLPREVSHQSGAVEVMSYLLPEGSNLKAGSPIALVQNWWADIELRAVGGGQLMKNFFDSPGLRASVRIGDPIALVICEPEERPHTEDTAVAIVVKTHRIKPGFGDGG